MKLVRTTLAGAALLLAAGVPFLHADAWDKLTYLTVKEPIQVPGAELPPGKYAVRLLESQSNRYIVQFFSDDRSKLYATVLAIPNEKMQPVEDTQLRFYETKGDEAPALRAWFYPGDTIGREFVYPRSEAARIAQRAGRIVPSMDDEMAKSLITSDAQATPVWRQETRIYTWGPANAEVSEPEALAMTNELDRQNNWRTRQIEYRRYYTVQVPDPGEHSAVSMNHPLPSDLNTKMSDIKSVVSGLEAHSDLFEKEFQKALRSSTVPVEERKQLENMVDDLEDSFDKLKKSYTSSNLEAAHRDLRKAIEVASRVNNYMTKSDFRTSEASWSLVRDDLNRLAASHNYPQVQNWGQAHAHK